MCVLTRKNTNLHAVAQEYSVRSDREPCLCLLPEYWSFSRYLVLIQNTFVKQVCACWELSVFLLVCSFD